MSDQNSRPAREVGIADHLWETYEDMAQQMGSDRDALINQAMFMFARLTGFIEVARAGGSEVAVAGNKSSTPLPEDSNDSDMGLSREDEPLPEEDEPQDEPAGAALILSTDNAEPRLITKDRFVLGRGKHCDLVINSGKVSREHAVIVREGDTFFIEDLDSSNGTWFNKQRIKRRPIRDGDEYLISSERVRLSYR
jgi:hypothetical protein